MAVGKLISYVSGTVIQISLCALLVFWEVETSQKPLLDLRQYPIGAHFRNTFNRDLQF